MDYKNFLNRVLFSILFLIIYFILFFNYSDSIFYFVTLIYLITLIEVLIYFNRMKFILIFYLVFSYLFLILYFRYSFDLYEFTFIILCISCFDSFSYLAGKILGKNKIFYKISPNKTYEGLLGGILITNSIFLLIYLFMDYLNYLTQFDLIILINIIICFSFFGDLLQSYFKRLNNLKDSSNFVPGHGGFFDRFDSFLLVIIPIGLLTQFY